MGSVMAVKESKWRRGSICLSLQLHLALFVASWQLIAPFILYSVTHSLLKQLWRQYISTGTDGGSCFLLIHIVFKVLNTLRNPYFIRKKEAEWHARVCFLCKKRYTSLQNISYHKRDLKQCFISLEGRYLGKCAETAYFKRFSMRESFIDPFCSVNVSNTFSTQNHSFLEDVQPRWCGYRNK